MGRPRKASAELASPRDCEDAMRRLGLAQIRLEGLQASLDRAITAEKGKYEASIGKADAEVKDLELQLQQYYLAHVEELERDGRKSVQLLYGAMGRRLSPPALKLLNRSWTWAAVMAKLRDKFGEKFLRLREPEVDKDKVKAELPDGRLKEFGLKVEQDEVFYAEPDRTRCGE